MTQLVKSFSLVGAAKQLPDLLKNAVASQDVIRATSTQIAQLVGADADFAHSFGISTAAFFTGKAGQNIAFCKPETILGALVELARYRLTLDSAAANAYLVPYGGACQLQLGYRGYEAIIRRRFAQFYAVVEYVLQSELSTLKIGNRYENGKNVSSIAHDFSQDRFTASPQFLADNAVTMYALTYLREGELLQISVMSRQECEQLRRLSPMQKGEKPTGVWQTFYLQMWKAKIMRRICKAIFTADGEMGLPDDYIHTVTDGDKIEHTAVDFDTNFEEVDADGATIVADFLAQIENAANTQELTKAAQNIAKHFGAGKAPSEIYAAFRAKKAQFGG